jgi:glycosyltransferase 2 family protein
MSGWSTRRALVALAVGVPVSAVLLWLAVRNADAAAVRRSLEQADGGLVVLAVVALMSVYAFQAVRWRAIAGVRRVGPTRFYELVVSGVACNNVLPARLGDLLRARWLGQEAGMPAGRAFGTVVLDRACDLAALVILLTAGLAAVATADWLVRLLLGGVGILLAVGLLLAFARVYTARRKRGRRERGLLRRLARDTAETLAEPLGIGRPAAWLALSLAAWATWALGALVVARSLAIDLQPSEALFVAAVMNLGVAIPSSPGFVGTYEWLGVASLGLLDVGTSEALAFAIVLHACWYVPTTLLGGAAIVLRAGTRVRRARAAAPAEPLS